MKQKMIAILDCGVEVHDTVKGITFVNTEPGREFCFALTREEFPAFEEYVRAYKAYYDGGTPVVATALPAPEKVDESKLPSAEDLSKREATQTVPTKIGENALRVNGMPRDVEGHDLVKEGRVGQLTGHKR